MNTQIEYANTFYENVQKYIQENNPKLYILTPCYGGVCYVNYVSSLIQTIELFKIINFPLQIEFCKNDSLVSRARNNLVAKAMNDPQMTHFIFIDADITWNPNDIIKLVLSNKEIVGGVYPIKHYLWDKLKISDNLSETNNILQEIINRRQNSEYLTKSFSPEQMIKMNMLKYNINFISSNLSVENNLTEVKHLATGFMMVQRNTIKKMIEFYPQLKYTDDIGFLTESENKYAYALFDCGVESGHYFSEDWMFCHRWKEFLNGKIYIDISINLTHTGTEDYIGSFIASIL